IGDAANDLTGGTATTIHVDGGVSGGGTLVLPFASNFPGGWFLANHTLKLQDPAALGTGAGAIDVNTNGILELNNITFDHGVTLSHNGAVRGTGTASATGTIVVVDSEPGILDSGSNSGNVFTVGNAPNDLTGGDLGSILTVTGLGKVVLTQSNDYMGDWILNGGKLRIENSAALGTGTAPIAVNAATLEIGGVAL